MPLPRRTAVASRRLDADHLHQLVTGMPRGVNTAGAWGLPRRWRNDEVESIHADMRRVYEQHRDEVIAYCRQLAPYRMPWAWWRFDAPEPRKPVQQWVQLCELGILTPEQRDTAQAEYDALPWRKRMVARASA